MLRKFLLLILLILISAFSPAHADPKIDFNVYKCKVCDKTFYSFQGDQIDDKKFKDKPEQLKRIFTFANRSKNFPECKNGFKTHIFDKKGTTPMKVSDLAKSNFIEKLAVLRDGGALNTIKLTEWYCVYCKKVFYSINDENLNIRDWERQRDFLFNLKGQQIYKCTAKDVLGHVFYPRTTGSVKSYELCTIVHDLYWVK